MMSSESHPRHIKTHHLFGWNLFVLRSPIMKFTTVFAVLATLAAAVSAAPAPQPELISNAKRLAVGLPPNPPARRDGTHVFGK